MKLYISFEQEAIVTQCGAKPGDVPIPGKSDSKGYFTGFVTVADNDLYDGPGGKAPGNVLAWIGPIPGNRGDEAINQLTTLLRKLGHEVLVCGKDY